MKHLKHMLLIIILIVGTYNMLAAQDPVRWETSAVQTGENTFDIIIKAKIDNGWHIYSQKMSEEEIGTPTSFKFIEHPLVRFLDKIGEIGNLKKIYIKETETWSYYYEDEVTFVQPVRVKDTKTILVVSGKVSYQVCTEEKCLPPREVSLPTILLKTALPSGKPH